MGHLCFPLFFFFFFQTVLTVIPLPCDHTQITILLQKPWASNIFSKQKYLLAREQSHLRACSLRVATWEGRVGQWWGRALYFYLFKVCSYHWGLTPCFILFHNLVAHTYIWVRKYCSNLHKCWAEEHKILPLSIFLSAGSRAVRGHRRGQASFSSGLSVTRGLITILRTDLVWWPLHYPNSGGWGRKIMSLGVSEWRVCTPRPSTG